MVHHDGLLHPEARAALTDVLRVFVGAVWFVAALAKLRAPEATRDSVRRLLGGPPRVVSAVALVLAPVELALGTALVAGWPGAAAAWLSVALFLAFAVVVARAAVRETLADGGCGCFGAPAHASAVDEFAVGRIVARNLVLAVLALAVAGGV